MNPFPVTELTTTSHIPGAQQKIIYARTVRNIKKKSSWRDKPWPVFIGSRDDIRGSNSRSPFSADESLWRRDVTATRKYFSARAERMPNAFPKS